MGREGVGGGITMNKTISRYLLLAVLAILLIPSVISRPIDTVDFCKQSNWTSGTTYYLSRDLGPVDLNSDGS